MEHIYQINTVPCKQVCATQTVNTMCGIVGHMITHSWNVDIDRSADVSATMFTEH